ncbi:hypothetical protein ANN_00536 [Periplaneta americana]|uniref:Uncharacterized protein n=1 Tax=Periplaneta americana TaxID=6978 RepID=A0ABQ8TR17_PERAM|nr:hypothetical protein ANN_00536 [Periplaneta americana]
MEDDEGDTTVGGEEPVIDKKIAGKQDGVALLHSDSNADKSNSPTPLVEENNRTKLECDDNRKSCGKIETSRTPSDSQNDSGTFISDSDVPNSPKEVNGEVELSKCDCAEQKSDANDNSAWYTSFVVIVLHIRHRYKRLNFLLTDMCPMKKRERELQNIGNILYGMNKSDTPRKRLHESPSFTTMQNNRDIRPINTYERELQVQKRSFIFVIDIKKAFGREMMLNKYRTALEQLRNLRVVHKMNISTVDGTEQRYQRALAHSPWPESHPCHKRCSDWPPWNAMDAFTRRIVDFLTRSERNRYFNNCFAATYATDLSMEHKPETFRSEFHSTELVKTGNKSKILISLQHEDMKDAYYASIDVVNDNIFYAVQVTTDNFPDTPLGETLM